MHDELKPGRRRRRRRARAQEAREFDVHPNSTAATKWGRKTWRRGRPRR